MMMSVMLGVRDPYQEKILAFPSVLTVQQEEVHQEGSMCEREETVRAGGEGVGGVGCERWRGVSGGGVGVNGGGDGVSEGEERV